VKAEVVVCLLGRKETDKRNQRKTKNNGEEEVESSKTTYPVAPNGKKKTMARGK